MANKYSGTKTEENLRTAFSGESQARNKYTYFASKAKKDGFEQIADLFLKTDRRRWCPASMPEPLMKQATDFVIWYKISRLKDRYIEKPNGVWRIRRRRLVPGWGKLSPAKASVNAD